MKQKSIIIVTALIFLCHFSLQAQVDCKGKDFWFMFGNNGNLAVTSITMQIRIVGVDQAATGSIYFTNLGTSVPFSVAANQVFTHDLDATQKAAVYNTATGTTNYSIHVTSNEPVLVYALNQYPASTDATNILPTTVLGTDYYQISYLPLSSFNDAYGVVATQNTTQVYHNGTPAATLNAGEVYYRAVLNTDMTGAHITSDKPIAYFSLNSLPNIPYGYGAGDVQFQQLAPVNTWGVNFFVPVTHRGVERVRIVASQNGTNITQTGGTLPATIPVGSQNRLTNLNAGEWVELEIVIANRGCFIQADKPVGVCTYLVGTSYASSGAGDPSTAWMPSVEQMILSATIAPFIPSGTTNLISHHAIVIVPYAAKSQTTLAVSGGTPAPISGGTWYDNITAGYAYYILQLANNASTTYTFANQDGLLVMGYAIGNADSYYYVSGSAFRSLDASFYVNGIHNQDLPAVAFDSNNMHFNAEIYGTVSTSPGHLKWFIDNVEETAARDLDTWTKTLPNGIYQVRMEVTWAGDTTVRIVESTLTIGDCLYLRSTGISSDGCVELEWRWIINPVDTFGFTLFQWDDALSTWQTTSTNYGKTIKVLNIYPDVAGSNTLKTWMDDPAIGLGQIQVTPVTITAFNANPDSYLKSGGSYIYDAIMFGTYDANYSRDLNPAASTAVRNYVNSGRGVLFGHDTQYNGHPNFCTLKDLTNLEITSILPYRGNNRVTVVNDGFLLKYPHLIPFNSILTIPVTHSTSQYAKGIVWMNFTDTLGGVSSGHTAPPLTYNGGTNNFYLTTWNNAAMIQTGHSSGQSTLDERKIIANTLWYLSQFTTDTTAKVCSARDLDAPDQPTANRKADSCEVITMLTKDNGSNYRFYIKATNVKDYADTCISNILDVTNKSGLRGFYVLENSLTTSIPDTSALKVFIAATDSQLVRYLVQDLTKYVHIQAIDSAGNLSTVYTISPAPTGTLSITASDTSVCAGTSITFTANLTYNSSVVTTTPIITWKKGFATTYSGAITTHSINTYVPSNGDAITAEVYLSASGCSIVLKSNTITVTVIPSVAPTINISVTR